jgi:hypothetical protein
MAVEERIPRLESRNVPQMMQKMSGDHANGGGNKQRGDGWTGDVAGSNFRSKLSNLRGVEGEK